MAVQFLSRFILPKKWHFGFISTVTFLTVLCMGSARMAFFIVLAAYVSFLFQKEHPLWSEFQEFFKKKLFMIGVVYYKVKKLEKLVQSNGAKY